MFCLFRSILALLTSDWLLLAMAQRSQCGRDNDLRLDHIGVFYSEVIGGRYVPRAILLDCLQGVQITHSLGGDTDSDICRPSTTNATMSPPTPHRPKTNVLAQLNADAHAGDVLYLSLAHSFEFEWTAMAPCIEYGMALSGLASL